MIEQNRMDRLRMDRMRQRVMEQNLNEQRRAEPMMLEKERQDQGQMSQNQMNQRQMSQNQMSQRQMSQNQMDQSRMHQNQMGHRMTNPMMRIGNQNDPRMYQDQMDMVNRRMLNDNRRQTGGNRMMRNNNVIERGQMQSGRMMKREAGPSFSYTVSTGHPSEQSLRMIDTINYLMPIVDSIPLQSLHQVHPDGGVSYRLPSLMMTYIMRPASMMVGSAVDVQQGGQSYGFRTRA